MLYREEPETPAHTMLSNLNNITKATLYCLTGFYEYKLLTRLTSSFLYVHMFIESVDNLKTREAVSWVFLSLAALSTMMTMVAGLLFLAFSYILYAAYLRQSLFGSGLLVED